MRPEADVPVRRQGIGGDPDLREVADGAQARSVGPFQRSDRQRLRTALGAQVGELGAVLFGVRDQGRGIALLAGDGGELLVGERVPLRGGDAHRLGELRLGHREVVPRADQLHLGVGERGQDGGEVDVRLDAGADEGLRLFHVLLLVAHRLLGDRHQIAVGAGGEVGAPDVEERLQRRGARVLGGRVPAGPGRRPSIAGLTEIVEQLAGARVELEVVVLRIPADGRGAGHDGGSRAAPHPAGCQALRQAAGAGPEVAGRALVAARDRHLWQVAGARLLDPPLGRFLKAARGAHVRLISQRRLLRLLQAERRLPHPRRPVGIVRGLRPDEHPEHHERDHQGGERAGRHGRCAWLRVQRERLRSAAPPSQLPGHAQGVSRRRDACLARWRARR